jgi:hypothetical protein
VVAIDTRYGLIALAHPQERVLFMKVDNGGHPRFVKLLHRWFDPEDALPDSMLTTQATWSLRVWRDTTCDERLASVRPITVSDVDTGTTVGVMEAVRYLGHEQQQPIPTDMVLPCYRVVAKSWTTQHAR